MLHELERIGHTVSPRLVYMQRIVGAQALLVLSGLASQHQQDLVTFASSSRALVAFQESARPTRLTEEELQAVAAAVAQTALAEARKGGSRSPLAVVGSTTLATCREAGPRHCITSTAYASIENRLGEDGTRLGTLLRARNDTAATVPQFDDRLPIVESAELEAVLRTANDWPEFYGRFGGNGLIRFSSPAIDSDRGVVFVTFSCGGLCGKSWIVVLERQDLAFRVRKIHLLAVS